jgi:hypothetical protein
MKEKDSANIKKEILDGCAKALKQYVKNMTKKRKKQKTTKETTIECTCPSKTCTLHPR